MVLAHELLLRLAACAGLLDLTTAAAAGFERLPEGQACANGTTLTTKAACQDALKSLMSILPPAGCKDNTGCCDGTNLPYGCSFRSANPLVFTDNKQSPSQYAAENERQAICHCAGGATHCRAPPPPPSPGPPHPTPPPPPPPSPKPPAPGPPANFSCAIGEAGFEFAKHVQPERTNLTGVWQSLVAPHCHGTAAALRGPDTGVAAATARGQPGHGLWGWRQGVRSLEDPTTTVCSLHVDSTAGKDAAGSGTATNPFRTIVYAITQVPRGQPCTVLLAAGTHHVHSTIVIGPELNNLTVQSAVGATAVISGGLELASLEWEPVANPIPDGGYGGLGKGHKGRSPPPPSVKVVRAKLPAGTPQLRELFDASGRLVPARTPGEKMLPSPLPPSYLIFK